MMKRYLTAGNIIFALMIAAFLGSMPSQSHAIDRKNFYPLSNLHNAMMPGGRKNPRFTNADKRINFYVEGAQLQSLLNKKLSTACAINEFNQIRRRKYYVNILMPDNNIRRFGFANGYGYNLRDVNNLKVKKEAYLFERDGTSECRVYSIATPNG